MARKGRATKVSNSTRGRGKGASTATASDGNATNNAVASTATRGRGGRGRAAPTVDTNARRRTRQAVKAGQNTSPAEEAPNDPEALARGAKTATSTAKGSAKTKTATTLTTETAPAPTSPVQVGSEQNATQGQEDVPVTAEEQPKTPKTPRTPKTPTTPKAPKSPTTPKTPKTPHTPKTPKAQKAPGTPKTPKTPKTPTTPPTPKTPNTPKTPKTPKTPIETEEAQNIVDGAEGQPLSPATGVKRDLPDEDADQQDESKRLKLDDEQTTTAPTSAQIETLMEYPSTEAAIQVDNDFEDGQAADREPPEIHYQSASLLPASSLLTPPEFRRVPTPPSGSLPQPSASPEQDERESSVEAPAVTVLPGPVWPVASTGDTEVDLGLTLQSEQGTTNPETENNKTASPDHDDVAQRRRDSQLRTLRAEELRQDVSTALPEIYEATIPKPDMEPSRQASDTTTTISEDDARDLDNDLDKDLFGEEEDVVEQSQVITTPPPPPPVQFATSRNASSPPPTPGKIISPTGLHLPATPGPTKTTFFGNGNGSGSPPFTPQKGQYSDEGLSGTQQARDLGTSAHGEGEMPSSVGATGEPRGVESLVAAVSRAIDGDGKVNEDEERVASHEEGEHGNDERSSKLDVMSGQRIGEGGEDVDLTNEELDELYE